MLDLAEIPFFAALPPASVAKLKVAIPVQHYSQGTVIARVGEPGRYFQAIAAGAVRIQPEADGSRSWRGFILGPGQVFGEMSLFTGMPISATLVAARDTSTYCLDGAKFLQLLDEEPALHRSLTRLLIDRLRYQTRNETHKPALALLTSSDPKIDLVKFAQAIAGGVIYYAPGSDLYRNLPEAGRSRAPLDLAMLEQWRQNAAGGQYLVVVTTPEGIRECTAILQPEDVVVEVLERPPVGDVPSRWRTLAGAADITRVYFGRAPSGDLGRWNFSVPWAELDQALQDLGHWQAASYPRLDHVVRYITFKEIGVALSSGAARGFAHVGVLETLEAHQIPVDFMCGTSMGGIAALTVARAASAAEGATRMRDFLGGNRKIRDAAMLPRSSLFTGQKIARAAESVFGSITFADLRLPVAVVASDLASGERAVIDSGPVAPAVLGTSAIPGFFPPIAHGSRLIVDGALVSRVPVDLLDRRRCGLRIAVNVVAAPRQSEAASQGRLARLTERFKGPFGLKHVLGASWEVLGSYGSTLEALRADIVITPETHSAGGAFDFDRYAAMIECGRNAALARIDAISEAVRALLSVGYR